MRSTPAGRTAVRARPRTGTTAIAAGATPVAAAAYYGAAGLASGYLGFPGELAARLPFGSATAGGAALAIVVGMPFTVLAVLGWRHDPRTQALSLASGVALMLWIAVEIAFIRELSFLQPAFLAAGAAFAVAGRHDAAELGALLRHALGRR